MWVQKKKKASRKRNPDVFSLILRYNGFRKCLSEKEKKLL